MCNFYANAKGNPNYNNLMEDSQIKSICGNLVVSNFITVTISMQSIYADRDFKTETDAWEKRAFNAKVWEEWKQQFFFANKSNDRKKLVAPVSNQFVIANAATQHNHPPRNNNPPSEPTVLFDKLNGNMDNLANVVINKKAVLEQLLANNTPLVAANAKLVDTNNRFTVDNTKLQLSASNTLCHSDTSHHHDPAPHTCTMPNGWTIGGFCHTNGYVVAKYHSRSTCKWRVKNHKDGATRDNIINGSTANKGWDA